MLSRSIHSCTHGLSQRGFSCASYESLEYAPIFVSDVVGKSLHSPRKQPTLMIPQVCETYFMVRSLSLLKDVDACHVTDVISLGSRYNPYSSCIDKKFRDTSIVDDRGNPGAFGLLVHRPVIRSSGYSTSIEDSMKDLKVDLGSLTWWVIPVSVDEVVRRPSCLKPFKYSVLMLPIASGRLVTKLCLVGYKGSGNDVPYWDTMDVGSLGWYNSCVSYIRVPPDLCRECWIVKGLSDM